MIVKKNPKQTEEDNNMYKELIKKVEMNQMSQEDMVNTLDLLKSIVNNGNVLSAEGWELASKLQKELSK